jgi:hypothetical protein
MTRVLISRSVCPSQTVLNVNQKLVAIRLQYTVRMHHVPANSSVHVFPLFNDFSLFNDKKLQRQNQFDLLAKQLLILWSFNDFQEATFLKLLTSSSIT